MDAAEGLMRLETLLADALTAADPAAALRDTGELPPELREAVERIDVDGLRVAALLVAKLRFQRLLNGSARAGEWFARDARGFTDAFRRYHDDVPPTSGDPWSEAAAFESWAETRWRTET